MHYRTPTDPGSSGSPVFNAKWEVVALHHAGSPATPRLHGFLLKKSASLEDAAMALA